MHSRTVAHDMYACVVESRVEYAHRVGVAIAAVRDYREMSQADLARAADLTTSSLSRYEAGRTPVPAYALAALAEALSVPVELLTKPAGNRADVMFAAVLWDRSQGRPTGRGPG